MRIDNRAAEHSTAVLRPSRRYLVGTVAIVVLAAACAADGRDDGRDEAAVEAAQAQLNDNVAFVSQTWPTDWSNSLVDLSDLILGVGATEPRDAIPPIDDPVFESIESAAGWLVDREPGALVQIGRDVRFFPLSIMTRHEIVNTELAGVPLAVTYCPLCNTAIGFDRRVDGDTLRFGVSGLLRNSDLVMWDDKTVSLWQQITGEAIVGELAGSRLDLVSTAIVSFGDFRADFPDGLSLSRDTGYDIVYGINRYEHYSDRITPLMPVGGESDNRYPALERVVGVSMGEESKAYPFSILSDERVVNDVVGDEPVAVLWGSPDTADALDATEIAKADAIGTAVALAPVVDGQRLTFTADGDNFTDAETGSTWTILGRAVDGPLAGTQLATVPHRNEFWFAWVAFFPDAAVYES